MRTLTLLPLVALAGCGSAGGGWSFSPEDDGLASRAVSLRLAPQAAGDPDLIWLEVVLRGVEQPRSLALEVAAPAQVVAVIDGEATPTFLRSQLSHQGGALQASMQSAAPGFSSKPTLIARVALSPQGDDPIPVTVQPQGASQVEGVDGQPVQVVWLGGTLRRGEDGSGTASGETR